MNSQTEENLNEYRLQKPAAEIDSDDFEVASIPIFPTSKLNYPGVPFDAIKIINWFWYLPSLAKLVVVVVGFLLGFVILQVALKLIAFVMSMALFAGLVYLGYKFIVAGNSSQIKE
ncbi:MAG: hypothetical protein ACFB2X_00150 [Rivularia sp. (in: cyanobacteria)]